MLLCGVWHDSVNTIVAKDENFNTATDTYVLNFEHVSNCSRFSVSVDSIAQCLGRVSFLFSMNCSVPPGEYNVTIHNESTSEDYDCVKVKVYANRKTCYNCSY